MLNYFPQIRFWDVSPHILVTPSPLRFEYPSPLPHLTISITNLIKHSSLRHLPIARLFKTNPTRVRITGIDLAQATLECLVHLESGEVFIHKFGTTKEKPSNFDDVPMPNTAGTDRSYFEEAAGHDAYDGIEDVDQGAESLTSTAHLANWRDDGFKPVTILTTRRGPIIASAMSDIGKSFCITFPTIMC
jgi:syntaxin-binding protein 5